MLHLGGADAEGEAAEGAMRRGMGIAAGHGQPGQGEALLGADHVHDALADVVELDIGQAIGLGVFLQELDLDPRFLVLYGKRAVRGRHVVVGDEELGLRTAHRATGRAQPLEGLGAGDLVDDLPVDIEQAGAVLLDVDYVAFPDLVEQGFRLRHRAPPSIGPGCGPQGRGPGRLRCRIIRRRCPPFPRRARLSPPRAASVPPSRRSGRACRAGF